MDARLTAAIDAEWIAERAHALVAIPSVTMDEAAVCRLYTRQLAELGLTVDVRPVTPDRNNLYACLPGVGGGPSLALNGHLDTIPIGQCPAARREGDRLYGRGATDMKSGLAATLVGTYRWRPGRTAAIVLDELHQLVAPFVAAGHLTAVCQGGKRQIPKVV